MTTEMITTNASASNVALFSPAEIILCMTVAVLLGSLIAIFYGWQNPEAGRNFLATIALLTPIVALVIIMVNGNLGTGVAVMGAFSLVRFRSVPGKGKEITVIFLAMAIGLAPGTGFLVAAVLSTVGLLFIAFAFQKLVLGKEDDNERLLAITIPESLNYSQVFTDLLAQYADYHQLLEVRTTNMGSLFKLQYKIRLHKAEEEKALLDELRARNGNLEITSSRILEDSGRL